MSYRVNDRQAEQGLDTRTLVPSSIAHLAWLQIPGVLAPLVLPLMGSDASRCWYNAANSAPSGAYLGAHFTVPPGVTHLVIEALRLQQHPDIGATSALALELWSGDGLVRVSTSSVTPGATEATGSSAEIAVTAGAEYQVRLVSSGSFLCGAVRARPTASADRFWLGNFVRIDPLGLLHGSSERPGYAANQPRFPRQAGYSEMRLRARAGSARVAMFTNTVAYLGAAAAKWSASLDGASGATTADYPAHPSGVDEVTGYTALTLTEGAQRVVVRGGEAVGSGYASTSPQMRQTAIVAIYLSAPPVEIERPMPGVVIGVIGDSIFTGAGATAPAVASLPTFLRARGYGLVQLGAGGGTAAQWFSTDALRADTAKRVGGCTHVVYGVGRNDLSGNTSTAQSTVVGYLDSGADEMRARTNARVLFAGAMHETSANEASSFGSGGATRDEYRTLVHALPAANGADGNPRASWSESLGLDAVYTIAQAAAGQMTADGTHPSTVAQGMMAVAISAAVTGCERQPTAAALLSLTPTLWCEGTVATGGAMGTVTATGTATIPTITLAGTMTRAGKIMIRCTSGGALGASVIQYSDNGGSTWLPSTGILTATGPTALGNTGVTVSCGSGTYRTDHLWTATCVVASWSDLSGNSNDLTQSITGARPPFGLQVMNGVDGLDYDGTTTAYLHAGGLSLSTYTIALLAKSTDTSTLRALTGAPAGKVAANIYYNSTDLYLSAGGSQIHAACDMLTARAIVAVVNGASSELWVDGVRIASGTTGGHTMDDLSIGYHNASGGKHKGPIVSALLFPSALSADGVRVVTGHLRRLGGTL